jgi:hypothetical protein
MNGGGLGSKDLLGRIVALALVGALAGCADLASTKLSEGAKEAANKATLMAKEKGAAIVVRVSVSGEYCPQGTVVLNRVADGKIDDKTSVNIGQVFSGTLRDFGKMSLEFFTLNVPALAKEYQHRDIRTSYVPIEPGKYVVTRVYCRDGQYETVLGGDQGSWFGPPPKMRPVLGANYIVVGTGQIVDAGILNIQVIQKDFRPLSRGTGMLVASEAPAAFRDATRLNLPDLYRKITYTKFSFNFGPFANQGDKQ